MIRQELEALRALKYFLNDASFNFTFRSHLDHSCQALTMGGSNANRAEICHQYVYVNSLVTILILKNCHFNTAINTAVLIIAINAIAIKIL